MQSSHLEAPGELIADETLTVPRARELLSSIIGGKLDFVTFVECRRIAAGSDVHEIIVADVDVERPQIVTNDIRRRERIALVFSDADAVYPGVLALRADFPLVPHLNLQYEEFPRSICLYDQSWDDIKPRWTAPAFIERIRRWLAIQQPATSTEVINN